LHILLCFISVNIVANPIHFPDSSSSDCDGQRGGDLPRDRPSVQGEERLLEPQDPHPDPRRRFRLRLQEVRQQVPAMIKLFFLNLSLPIPANEAVFLLVKSRAIRTAVAFFSSCLQQETSRICVALPKLDKENFVNGNALS